MPSLPEPESSTPFLCAYVNSHLPTDAHRVQYIGSLQVLQSLSGLSMEQKTELSQFAVL